MATGTVTKITENVNTLIFEVTVSGTLYSATVPRVVFDALTTNLDKQNYVVEVLTNVRRSSRQFENIYPALIGASITIPD